MNWLAFVITILLTSFGLIITANDLSDENKETRNSISRQIISITRQIICITNGPNKYTETELSTAYKEFSDFVFEGSQNESQYLDKMVEVLYRLEHICNYP